MNTLNVIDRLAAEEKKVLSHEFVAPVAIGGKVRIRVAGAVKTLFPVPASFFGWGLFKAKGKQAVLSHEAAPWEKDGYLEALRKRARFRLCVKRWDDSWWALPSNHGQAKTLGLKGPQIVWLAEGSQFDTVIAATDGTNWWFANRDPQDNPEIGEKLRGALADRVSLGGSRLGGFRIKGMSAEDRECYETAFDPFKAGLPGFRPKDEDQLAESLRRGGGKLLSYSDKGDHWNVEWQDGRGTRHTSAVGKQHQTVLSAGICLSGRDKDFDLTCLVDVVEGKGGGRGHDYEDDDD